MCLEQKSNRRIDFLLHTLLTIAKDNIFERLTKLEKGKYTHRISEINKRHKSAVKLLLSSVVTTENSCWTVRSERDGSLLYTVKLTKEVCECKLQCSICKVCAHQYSCSCMESKLHATVFKHVHLVVMMLNRVTKDTNNEESCLKYFSNLLENKTINKEITALRQQVLGKITELSMIISECNDRDALKTTSNHVNSALMAIKAIQNISTTKIKYLPIKRKIVPNKLSKKQPRFFSTKNKTTNKIKRVSKPTYEQIKYSKSLL